MQSGRNIGYLLFPDFTRVQNTSGVEGPLQVLHQFQFRRFYLLFEEFPLGDAHPVLSGNRSPQSQSRIEKLTNRSLDFSSFGTTIPVAEKIDVQVAISGMPEGGNLYTIFCC